MKKGIHILLITVALICTFITGQVYAANSAAINSQEKQKKSITVFGPKTFTREKNKPSKFVSNFPVKDTGGTFTLIVRNNSKTGKVCAVIKLNEEAAFKFNKSVKSNESIEMPLKGIKSQNKLTVDLTGSIVSSISITVKTVKESTEPKVSPAQTISVSEFKYDFKEINIGSSSPAHTFTITNNSSATNMKFSIVSSNQANFEIVNDNVSNQILEPGKARTFDVKFNPSSEGSCMGVVTLIDMQSGACITITLSGKGIK